MRQLLGVGCWAFAAGCLAFTTPMLAVLSTTETGATVRWTLAEIVLHPELPGSGGEPLRRQLAAALTRSAAVWNDALAGCAAPRLRVVAPRTSDAPARADGRSQVVVRADSWCPHRYREREDCYDPSQAGITRLYPRIVPGAAEDGDLREADIEINAVHSDWFSELAASRLEALLAHELGHVLGLAHPLASDSAGRESVMYFDPLEAGRPLVLKPGQSEIDGLCALYPRRSAADRDAQ
jgi:hypothetical protein